MFSLSEIICQLLASLFILLSDSLICGSSTYTPSLGDVGYYLALYWVPTREDGLRGQPITATCNSPVAAGMSPIRFLFLGLFSCLFH